MISNKKKLIFEKKKRLVLLVNLNNGGMDLKHLGLPQENFFVWS